MKRIFFLLTVSLIFVCQSAWSQTLPSGFTTTTVGSGWTLPLGTAFTSDGQKMFVWEKDGRVYVCNRNAAGAYIKQTTPVLDISEEVANWGDHGLMGFALDPNYLSNGLIYLLYVVDRHYLINFGTPAYNPATSSTGATIGRITRYKTNTTGGSTLADLSTRFILLGETKQTGICIMHDSHGLGTLAFAADGTLLSTAGDGASYYLVDKGSDTDTDFGTALNDGIIRPAENVGAFRAQILNSHNGKLLRLDPVTGNGVSSNPYYSAAQPRSPKSRVWALGLRNPYRFSIKPGTGSTNPAAGDVGEIFVGDVGWNTYEEVSIITTPGVNCGWPLFEGLTPQPGYTSALTANLDEPNPLFGIGGCTKQYFNFQDMLKQVTADNNKTVFNSCSPSTAIGSGNRYVHQRPAIEWKHFTNEARVGTFTGNNASVAVVGTPESNVIGAPFPGNCATGGPWYSGTSFPAAYQNIYFAADHDGGWIRGFKVDFTDVVTEVKNFASGLSGPVCVTMNPLDGTLFVVELGNFSTIPTTIKQIKYGGNQSPIVKMTSDKTFGPSALSIAFTGNGSSDPDGTVASYLWNFGDGGTSTLASPSHSFSAPVNMPNAPAKYVTKLTVTDNLGATSVDSIIISVNNTPPVVNITSPVKNSLYKIGPDTAYTCSATVTDVEHNAASLKYEWQTFLRHNSHAHPEPISTAISPTTTISRIGCNGDTYYWLIKLTVTDAAGLSSSDSSKIFPDCSPGSDITPPIISSVSPLTGANNVSTGTVVTAVFNETVDPATVTNTNFQLKDAANNVIAASINTSFNQITLTPAAVLTGSTVYTVTIKGGVSGVKDPAANALVNDYVWSFTTAAVDNTAPTVTLVSPINGSTGINIGTTVAATFSEAINLSTVTAATVQLRDAGNNLIAGTLNASSNQFTFTPSAPLSSSTQYTVTIKGGSSGVKDLAANPLASDYSWSFTTAIVDIIAPTVSSVSPANGAANVNIGTTVTANFSEAVNAATVTNSTFQLKDATNNIIPAFVTTAGNQIILTPSVGLTGSATYTVIIKSGMAGVKDEAGNPLATDYTWSFTITSQPPVSIQSSNTKTGTAATVHALTGVPAGALLVLATTSDAVVSNAAVSSVPALTWTKRSDAGAASSDNAEIWTAVYTAGGSISVTSNWGAVSQASVCYIVLNAESLLNGAFATAVSQFSPSVAITTTRPNSIIFGCTADWKAINGTPRTLRDGATESLYYRDGNYTTYHYTKAASSIATYTEGVSLPTGQQSSTALLEIRGVAVASDIAPTITTQPALQTKCDGATALFTSAASGSPTPTVQWQESTNVTTWTNITGATGSTLSFAATIADNSKQYRAVWTNIAGFINSNAATLTVNALPAQPVVGVVNNCGSSVLTASNFTGSLAWSTGATTASITVATGGNYSVTQTVNGCASTAANGLAIPNTAPPAPSISVINNCGNSVLTATGFTGTLLWNTGETTASITAQTGGTYTVTQTVNGCVSNAGSAIAAPKANPATPTVSVANNCGNSVLTASGFTGTLLWSTGATTNSITVNTGGTYTVTQTVNGCTSEAGSGLAAPLNSVVATPTIAVVDECGQSIVTAVDFTGTLLWSTGATTNSITVTTGGTYTLTQTVNGCTSAAATGLATPKIIPAAPSVGVVNNCESTTLTASNFGGSLLWSTGESTASITVTTAAPFTVTQTVNGCTSLPGSGTASPFTKPAAPSVTVVNNCGNSVLTAGDFTGTLLWSTGATTNSITVSTGGTYTVTQTVNGCTSETGSGLAAPLNSVVATPTIEVVDNCGQSVLTAGDFTGTLLWSTGATSNSIIVTTGGTYTLTQTVGGCTSAAANGLAAPKIIPTAPSVTVTNNCESSTLTASNFGGSLLWSTGETTSSITVTAGGIYAVTQTVNGCTSLAGSGTAAPATIPPTPSISVVNNCGNSVLTASGFTGTLLWSTGATTNSITVTAGGTYTVTQTVNNCTSEAGSTLAAPLNSAVATPTIEVADNCGNSVLTAGDFTGTLLWSTSATTNSINVTTGGTYTVTQTLNGCTSAAASKVAAPKIIPAAPSVSAANNCESSTLTASNFSGSLLWSTGETSTSITVTTGGTYTVTQIVNGCISLAGSGTAAPVTKPATPSVAVSNNCGNSVLTASGFTGSLLWSNGATTASITVTTGGSYAVTQTVNGCTSAQGSATAAPFNSAVDPPSVTVVNNCANSTLTAGAFTGTLLWSNGATTSSITVSTPGTYSVTQTVNGCTSPAATGIATPLITTIATPSVTVVNNCGNSVLTASGFTGSLLWSNGATTPAITVASAGTFTVTQTINGCTSATGNAASAPKSIPATPNVAVVNNCGNSVLTASGFTGSLLWSTGATTNSIAVNTGGTYTVTQTVNGCTSAAGTSIAEPKVNPTAPLVTVVNNCGNSTLTASAFTGSLLWSNAAITAAITVNNTATYTVTQTVNGCTSLAGSAISAPKAIPVLSGSLTAAATSGAAFAYTAGSTTAGTVFSWSRAAVAGISNAASSGTGNINETLVNTSGAPVNVTYVYTLTANGCVNTQNVVVAVSSAVVAQPITIQSFNTKTGTAATVHALTGVPANALLVLATTSDAVLSNAVVSSVPALTWTKRVDAGAASSDNAEIWTAVYTAGGSINVTSNWGAVSQASVCYIILNAETSLAGASATGVSQAAPSVLINTTKDNSIIIGCTADWKNINGATRTLRDAATERLYFRDGHYTTYHYTKAAAAIGAYTEGVSAPTGQQASTALLEIRGAVAVVDITSPTITSVSPVNGATGLSINTTASAIFSEAMDAATINSSTVELRNAANVLITTAISYNVATRTVTITPSAALSNSTTYTATVKGTANGVKDAASNPLVNNFSWSFSTEIADIILPTVTAVTPVNGTTGVSVGTAPAAIFSEAMNAATINNTTIELRNAASTLIATTVSYNAATRTATITPTATLANLTGYTVIIKGSAAGAKDLANNALATDYSWSFTTTALPAQGPVTIQSFNTKTGAAATVHALTAVSAGALLVLATTSDAVLSNAVVSSVPALTWTKRVDAGATSSDNAEIWTAVYTAGGTINVTSNWGAVSQASVCYIVLNAEPTLAGAMATGVSQAAPSVLINTTRDNSIIFGCTADWKNINGTTRTLRDAATERLYFRDTHYTTYHFTKAAATIGAYTEGVSAPTGQQASTALLEIRGLATVATRPANSIVMPLLIVENPSAQKLDVNVMPNPSNTFFTLAIKASDRSPVQVKVTDIFGHVVERYGKIAGNSTLRMGHRWASGTYFVEVVQDNQRKFLKVIKIN